MPDNDEMVLEDAGAVVFTLEKALRRAVRNGDPGALRAIKPQHSTRVILHRYLLTGEIDQAADAQQLVEGAIKFVGFIAKFV